MNLPASSVIELGSVRFGNQLPLALIAGPCAMESRAHALETAAALKEIASRVGIGLVYKSSFDKANRTSSSSARGIGLDKALTIFAEIKEAFGLPVLTDVHENEQCAIVGEVVDILQIPAFLCRQTDLLVAAAKAGRVVNIKKGQFLAPWDMANVAAKVTGAGNPNVLVTERGASFGYNSLVSDMRSLPIMAAATGAPVIFDATHSVQQPGGKGTASGGERQFVPVLARAAVAVGVAGIFIETHRDPDRAPSDGPNMVPLHEMEGLLARLKAFDAVAKATRRSLGRLNQRDAGFRVSPGFGDGSAAGPIGRDPLVRQPRFFGLVAGLPKHVDRDAAAGMPVAADAQEARLEQLRQPTTHAEGAILVEGAVIPEAVEVELERLRLDQPAVGNVVDDQDRKIRVAGDRTQAGELGRREPGHIIRVRMRVRHAVETGLLRRFGNNARLAELEWGIAHGVEPVDLKEMSMPHARAGVAYSVLPDTLISTSTRYLRTPSGAMSMPSPGRSGAAISPLRIALQMVGRELEGERFRGERELADAVIGETRIGLQRSAEGEMRREGVVDVGHAPVRGIVRDLLRWADAADAAAIDLDEADAAEVDEVARHGCIVRSLAAGELHLRRAARQGAIGLERAGLERLLEPDGTRRLQGGQPRGRRLDVLHERSGRHRRAGCRRGRVPPGRRQNALRPRRPRPRPIGPQPNLAARKPSARRGLRADRRVSCGVSPNRTDA